MTANQECTLPEGWAYTKLDQIALWGSGGTPSRQRPEFFRGDIPWIKTGELGPKYIRSAEEHISQKAVEASAAKLFPRGSVGIAMYGATIGKASIWGIEAATNQACGVAQCYPGIFNEFLYYFLLSQQSAFVSASQGGAQPNISQTILKGWQIALPPTAEQRRIVAKIEELLSELDKGVDTLTTALKQIVTCRHSILKQAFSGRLVVQDVKDELAADFLKRVRAGKELGAPREEQGIVGVSKCRDNSLPHGWVSTTLEQVALWGSGGTPSRKRPEFFSGNIPWIKTGELGPKYVRSSEEYISEKAIQASAAKVFPKGSVGIAMYGATIGETSIWGIDAATNQACAVARCHPEMFNEFLYYFLVSQQPEFVEAGKGGAQPNISQTIIRSWPIAVPPLAEQHRIVAKIEELFSELDKSVDTLTVALKQIVTCRHSILKHAFSGRLVAQDTKDEPAATVLDRLRAGRDGAGAKRDRHPKNGKMEAA